MIDNALESTSLSPPARFLILGNGKKRHAKRHAEIIRKILEEHGGIIERFELGEPEPITDHNADMAIVLGGDGAFLRAATQVEGPPIPFLGINLGRLGFLADLSPEQFAQVCPALLQGQYQVTRHIILDCHLERDDTRESWRVANEAVISAGPPFRITDVELTIEGQAVATYSGDGLIVSTPIGSTAHNLAAGGPILVQHLPAVVITPICPHSLTWRPLVESANRRFELRCPNPSEGTTLIVDGYRQRPITADHTIVLKRSSEDLLRVQIAGHGYYRTLTEKLHWGRSPTRPRPRRPAKDRPKPPE
ncbi:NAD(+)/NADH kinase [Kolteria novifilia]